MSIRNNLLVLSALASISLSAGIIQWDFQGNGAGDLGVTSVFTPNTAGPSLTVSGFSSIGGDNPQLYGRKNKGDEVGLGLDLPLYTGLLGSNFDFYHEILPFEFIQVDISPLLEGYTDLTFKMNSTTGIDGWLVYATNTPGSIADAHLLKSGNDENSHGFHTNKMYLDFTASDGDVLLRRITATSPTPEPGSVGLLGIGLLFIGIGAVRRRNAQNSMLRPIA